MCVPTAMIDEWLRLDILRVIQNMEGELVLALIAVACKAKVVWAAFSDQEWFS